MAWVLTNLRTSVDMSSEASGVKLVQRAYAETSRLSFSVADEAGTLSLLNEDEIVLMDGAVKAFQGPVRTKERSDRGVSAQRFYVVECQDFTTYLGDDYVPSNVLRSTVESDKARIAWLGATYGTRGLVFSGATIATVRATMPEQDFSRLTLHQAMTLICSITGGSFYVDYDKTLHYHTSEVISAPFGLSDAPNGTTTFGFHGLKLKDDTTAIVNEVLVIGTDIETTRYLGGVAPAAGTKRGAVLEDPEIKTLADAQAAGDAFITKHGTARTPSELRTYKAGLKAGMTTPITHSGHGLAAVNYRISGVEAESIDKDRIEYTVYIGSSPISLASILRQNDAKVAGAYSLAAGAADAAVTAVSDLSAGGGNLVANSSFEDGTSWTPGTNWTIGVDPVSPEEPFAGVDVARIVGSATTSDLQTPFMPVARGSKYWASAWIYCRSRSAGSVDVVLTEYNAAGTLLATTVLGTVAAASTEWSRISRAFAPAAGVGVTGWNVSTTKVRIILRATGFTGTLDVDGVQLERGDLLTAYAPLPYELIDGSITGPKIAALTVALGNLAALSVDATKITTGAVTTPKIAANAVTANEIAALTITAAEIGANAITAVKIAASAVESDKIAANAIVAGKIAAGIITATEMAANSITADKIAADAVTAGKIAAEAVTAVKIAVGLHPGDIGFGSPNNLIGNPGFEQGPTFTNGTVNGWICTVVAGATVQVRDKTSASDRPNEGIRYLQITNGATANAAIRGSTYFPASPGEVIDVAAYVKSAVGSPSILIAIQVRKDTGDETTFLTAISGAVTGSYVRYSGRVTMPADTVGGRVYIQNSTVSTWLYIDDIVVTRPMDLVNAAGSVVIDQTGIAITNGKLTVTNPGSTVIIDGTSNMFKIASTGTTSLTVATGAGGIVDVVLSGLGALSTTPTMLSWISATNATDGTRWQGTRQAVGAIFVAATSGGAVTTQRYAATVFVDSYTFLDASSFAVFRMNVSNLSGSSITHYARYYVMKETAV